MVRHHGLNRRALPNSTHSRDQISKLVLASNDDHLLSLLTERLKPIGIEVLSLADICVPEPPISDAAPALVAAAKAAAVSATVHLPAIGAARIFRIDPLLRFGGGLQWCWPVPWPGRPEELAAELFRADDALNRGGYCGPDDRGALLLTVLCLVTPEGCSRIFEGRVQGQFARLAAERRKSRDFMPEFLDCFVPESRHNDRSSDQKRAIDALSQALETSSPG